MHVIDIESIFSNPDGSVRVTDSDGHQLYQDEGHLSDYGAQLVRTSIERQLQ